MTRQKRFLFLILGMAMASLNIVHAEDSPPPFWSWASKPPMGWNSWDCFATTVTEAQTRGQADFMADKLKPFGWEDVVVDIQWYEPEAKSFDYRKNAALVMDRYGRLLPAPNRFPSAADGAGFKPLADYVHGKGLKIAWAADIPGSPDKYVAVFNARDPQEGKAGVPVPVR